MSQVTKRSRGNFRTIMLTGLVSLAVGVASGLLINYLTEKRAKLSYDITTQEVFPGQQNNIGIFALRIVNDGKREIEQLLCHLRFTEGQITERRVTGIPDSARTIGGSATEMEVLVPFLNPGEQFSIQILLGSVKQPLGRPIIEVRGKGILGAEVQPEGTSQGAVKEVLPVAIAALGALITLFITVYTPAARRAIRHLLGLPTIPDELEDIRRLVELEPIPDEPENPAYHSGDQRDILAFVLECKGLKDDARIVRESQRKSEYWAASDALCNKWIGEGDQEKMHLGLQALQFLVEYASISDNSVRIIQLNMAKLALAINEDELAQKWLAAAQGKEAAFIEKRIMADPALMKTLQRTEG